MNQTIYLCDFNDSFTFQIVSELLKINPKLEIQVIEHKNLLNFFQNFKHEQGKIILGPGPGHPKDYEYLYPSLQKLFGQPQIKFLGICLGHQLIWSLKGKKISHCFEPKHGFVETYQLSQTLTQFLGVSSIISVQRYNSLSVKATLSDFLVEDIKRCHFKNNELIISCIDNFISYQFHPESVGTDSNKQFFQKFLGW